MKKERRWLKSVIAATTTEVPALPWARGLRRKPASLKQIVVQAAPRGMAAR